jgi:hypothetical protein
MGERLSEADAGQGPEQAAGVDRGELASVDSGQPHRREFLSVAAVGCDPAKVDRRLTEKVCPSSFVG